MRSIFLVLLTGAFLLGCSDDKPGTRLGDTNTRGLNSWTTTDRAHFESIFGRDWAERLTTTLTKLAETSVETDALFKEFAANVDTDSAARLRSRHATLKAKLVELRTLMQEAAKLLAKDKLEPLIQRIQASGDSTRAQGLRRSLDQFHDQMNKGLDTILAMEKGAQEAVTQRLRVLGEIPIEIIRASPTESPIVSTATEGGRIAGTVRDSVSGRAIAEVRVGFKTQPTTSYFYETRTGTDGAYRSPYLRSGEYYVDMIRDGFVDTRNQRITVTRGETTPTNVGLTAPVGAAQYRIVMSWCAEKAGAVRDVDSYLAIPGTASPLYYSNRNYEGSFLDRDDTDWEGPETTTIHNVRAGEYVYYVNNYDRRDDKLALGRSDVRVLVYKGSTLLRTYRVPAGTGTTYELFRLKDGVLTDVQRYNDTLRVY